LNPTNVHVKVAT